MITNLTSFDLKNRGKLDYIEFSYAMANMAAFIIPGCENCLAKTVENINSFFNYIDCNQDKFGNNSIYFKWNHLTFTNKFYPF
jgi:hypothetical protein